MSTNTSIVGNTYITVGRPSGYSSSVTTGGGLDVSGILNSSTGVFLTPGNGASLTLTSTLFGYNTGYWPTVANGGLQIGWNSIVSGTGTTDFLNNGQGGSGGFMFATTSAGSTGITPLMTIRPGAVGIGTTNPSYPLHVIGNIGLTGAITPLYFCSFSIGCYYYCEISTPIVFHQ